MLLGAFGVVAMLVVGCAAPSAVEGKKSKTSDMRTDDLPESGNIEDRRDDPPRTHYPPTPLPPPEPVDDSPGSLADQAGINSIGHSPPQDGDDGEDGYDGDDDDDDEYGDDDDGDYDDRDDDDGDDDDF